MVERDVARPWPQTCHQRRCTQTHCPPAEEPAWRGSATRVSTRRCSVRSPQTRASGPKRCRKRPATPARWRVPWGWYTATSPRNSTPRRVFIRSQAMWTCGVTETRRCYRPPCPYAKERVWERHEAPTRRVSTESSLDRRLPRAPRLRPRGAAPSAPGHHLSAAPQGGLCLVYTDHPLAAAGGGCAAR